MARPRSSEYTAGYDGKDYLFTGNLNADAISFKRIDDFTVEATTKKAGKVCDQWHPRSFQRRQSHDNHAERDQRKGRAGQQYAGI